MGCDDVQGFYWAAAMSADELAAMLARGVALPDALRASAIVAAR